VKGLAHITGSGLPGNVPRCIPDGLRAVLHESAWKRPAIFDMLQRLGEVERNEMFSTFNMGLGMTAVVAPGDVKRTLEVLAARNVVAWEVGAIEAGTSGAESEAIVAP
jgi:phosphoribosylformylglycinamidine cyclo-ligase